MTVSFGTLGSKTQCWIGERPTLPTLSGDRREHDITLHDCTPRNEIVVAVTAAVERFKPMGPSSQYGLLGAVFEPTSGRGSLLIRVVAAPLGEIWTQSGVAAVYTRPRPGLYPELAEAIEKYLVHEAPVIGSGVLTIDMACVDEAASSPMAFGILAGYLVASLRAAGGQIEASEVETDAYQSLTRMRGKGFLGN